MLRFNRRYYEQLINVYGYDFCKNMTNTLENFSKDDLEKWLCAFNLSSKTISTINPKNTIVIMGIGVNAEPHIGTISQILRALYFQSKGYYVEIILGDLDSYNARAFQMSTLQKNIEKYRHFIKQLGFDSSKGIVRTQLDAENIMKTAFLIAQQVKDSDFDDVTEDLMNYYEEQNIIEGITFPLKLTMLLTFADFIHHGLHNECEHVIVLSGIDEHAFVPKAEEIRKKLGLDCTISGLFSDIIRGFNNKPKMSKSIANSSIYPSMTFEEIKNLLLNGDNDYESYEDSIVYQIMSSTFIYSRSQLQLLAKHCEERSQDWLDDKEKFAISLYRICKAW